MFGSIIRSTFHFAFIALPLLSIAGCSENPVVDDDHAEVHGLVLRDGDSVEVVRIEEDSVLVNTIVLDVDSTASYTLLFFDHHGAAFLPDEEITPRIESSDTTIIAAALTTGTTWTVTMTGRTSGTADISIVLAHGGHDDFRSPPITVVVE